MSARSARRAPDKALDAVLLLYFLKQTAPVLGRLKVQKTGFFVELALQREEWVGPHFKYYRWDNGPFSRELWNDLDRLKAGRFVEETPIVGYCLTDRGRYLLDLAMPDLRDVSVNEEVFSVMDAVLTWCKPKTGGELMKEAYEVVLEPAGMPGSALKVRDIPIGVDIFLPGPDGLQLPEATLALVEEELSLSPEVLEAALSDPEASKAADERLLAMVNGNAVPQSS